MLANNFILHLPKKFIFNYVKRVSTSALYISGDKAHETFAVLTPHIDFDERLKNKAKLEENIKLRELNVNLSEIVSVWIFYKKFQSQKLGLEYAKANIGKSIKALSPEKSQKEIDVFISHGKMVRADLKAIKDSFYSVEENAITKVLSLPNIIHEKTPILEPLVIHKTGDPLKIKSKSNYVITQNLDLVEYSDSNFYFLKNDASLFELGSTFHISDELLKREYHQFSNSDFARSVIVEGCGIDYSDPKQIFTIMETDAEHKHENSRLHLTGGCTLASFMAYHTKHTIFPSLLPLKYFTTGRKYNPVSSNDKSLFNVPQETAIDIFVATKDDINDMNLELDNVIKDIIEIYDSLGYHYRISFSPVKQLKKWESLRVSIEMYSCHLEKYMEVGYLSVCDNYVSKRLLFNYGTGYNINFPRIISGTVSSVPKILACIMEHNDVQNKNTLLHDSFKKYFS